MGYKDRGWLFKYGGDSIVIKVDFQGPQTIALIRIWVIHGA